MDAKHTPGPWEIEATEDGKHHWISPVEAAGNGWVGDRYMLVSGAVDIHDARLIAAAPDLLDALREASELIDLLRKNCADRVTVHESELLPIRAAIAKATGSAA